MYIIGGSTICYVILYLLGKNIPANLPAAIWIVAAGFVYGVGYAVHEIFSILHVVNTAPILRPQLIWKWFYRRFTQSEWQEFDVSRYDNEMDIFEKNASEIQKNQYYRIVGLKHICSTLGSCWFLSSIILILSMLCDRYSDFNLVILCSLLVLSVGLIPMCWVKGMQQVQYVHRRVEFFKKKRSTTSEPIATP